MLPVVAIVGRPNVGKSTLFNQLTRSRAALVVDLPGTTRDRKYGTGQVGASEYILIDTGGMGLDDTDVDIATSSQAWLAAEEADIILFMVDAKQGLLDLDQLIANKLRYLGKPVLLVVNKTDGIEPESAKADFYSLGFGELVGISASHGRGIKKLADKFLEDVGSIGANFFETEVSNEYSVENTENINANESLDKNPDKIIKLAIVGQPNVGKSTLVNYLLQEQRVIVSDQAGTTRDSIVIPYSYNDKNYKLIDTAGVRRKGKIKQTVEKFSVVKTLQSIKEAHVVIFLLDATRGILAQDLNLLSFIAEAGKALVIAINKDDKISLPEKQDLKKIIDLKLGFVDFAKKHFISALNGSGINKIFMSVNKAYANATRELSTNKLTNLLEKFIVKHQPPLVNGRRIKLRYAHAGGHNPPRIIIHGNQTEQVDPTYKRYLIKSFINELGLEGTPVFINFKTGDNPYS